MRVGNKNVRNRWIGGKSRSSGVLRAQRKRRGEKVLACAVRKVAGHSSQRSLPKIVKDTKACAQDGGPIRSLSELIGKSHPGRHISISCIVKRRAAGCQGHRRWIIEAD